jgi:tetratricopeptide (TPR) repeat protein
LELVGRATLPIQVFTGGMQAIIRRRLSYVPAWGRRLLQLAAITGREIDLRVLEVLRQSLESPPELEKWLLTCANVAVLEVREGVWRFAHDKLREGALLELERHEEVELHRQVALAIENIYGDSPEQAARLVTHWDMAGDARKRGYYARIAGQKALEISIYADAIRYFRLALAWAEDQSNAQDRAEILCKIGTAYRYMGDYPNALPLLEESLLIAETGQDLVTMTEALRQLGSIENNQGRYTDALNRFTASLELARQTGNQEIEGLVISNLGDVNRSLGNTEAAISYHQQALGIARHLNNPWQEGISLDNLGGVYHDLGQLKRAIEYRQEAVALFVAIGNRRSESIAHANLGTSYQSSGHYANALEHYQKALTIAQDIGDVVGEGICLDKLGDAYHDLGNWQLAQEYYLKTLYISRQVGNRRNEANRLEDLAMVYLHLYQFEQAIESAEMAYTIAQELGDANAQVLYGTTLGWVLLAHQKVDPARAIVHRVMKNFPDNPHLYQAAVCFGIICLHDQHPSGAQRAFNQAIELAQQVLAATPANYRAEYVIALATTGLALLRERPMEEAIAAYHKSRALASHKGLREEEMRRLIEMERSNIGKVREVFQVLTT